MDEDNIDNGLAIEASAAQGARTASVSLPPAMRLEPENKRPRTSADVTRLSTVQIPSSGQQVKATSSPHSLPNPDVKPSVAESPSITRVDQNKGSAVDLAVSTTIIIEKTLVGSFKKTVPTSTVRTKTCCQRFWKSVVSLMTDMVLLIVVGFYTVLGGFLFKYLESGEASHSMEYTVPKKRMQLALKIFGMMETPEHFTINEAKQWRNDTLELLKDFEIEVAKEAIIISEEQSDPWTLASAILFSVTLITTIGYGNIAPKTTMGKLCTIGYSLFGIPLTLMYLANIGGTMAIIFKWFYEIIMKLIHGKKAKAERSEVGGGIRVPVTVTSLVILGYICLGAMIFSIWEQNWTIIDSAYFCFITLSTIGLGDYVFGFEETAQSGSKQLVSSLYLIFGLSLLSMGFNLLQDEIINKYLKLMTRLGMREKKRIKKDTGSSTFDSQESSNDGTTSTTSAWSDEDKGKPRMKHIKNGQSTTRSSRTLDTRNLPAVEHHKSNIKGSRDELESLASIQTMVYDPPENGVTTVKKKKRCRQCIRILSIIISNLFLLFLVGLYTAFGSFLFHVIEGSRSPRPVPNMTIKKRAFALKLLANTEMPRNVTVTEAVRWTREAEMILDEFQALVTKIAAEAPREQYKWTRITSAIYSVTLITTIGYGNITPQTNLGRIATVIYSMFGIPLTFLYLANIGDTMANLFKRFYSRLLRCCSRKTFTLSEPPGMVRVPVKVTVLVLFIYIALGAILFALWEHKWSWIIGGYFCFITLSTIGLGDFVFGFDEDGSDALKQIVCGLYVLFGLSVISMGFNLLQDEILHQYIDFLRKVGIKRQTMSRASMYPGGEGESSDASDGQ